MEPHGLSRLGFQPMHVNPHKATRSVIHGCGATAKNLVLQMLSR